MPVTRFVNPRINFVLSVFSGCLTNDALSRHMADMVEATEGMVGYSELADCSGLTDVSALSVGAVAYAGSYKAGRGSRVAILVGEEPVLFGMARAFQTLSSETSEHVELFVRKEEALEWLSDGEDELKEMIAFVAQCEEKRRHNV